MDNVVNFRVDVKSSVYYYRFLGLHEFLLYIKRFDSIGMM